MDNPYTQRIAMLLKAGNRTLWQHFTRILAEKAWAEQRVKALEEELRRERGEDR
jgi:hypothetical protein